MSKLPTQQVRDAVEQILLESKEKKRNFQETVELQIGLKNYDTKKDKRFAGSVKLPHCPRPNMKIAILGNAVHIAEAEKLGVEKYDVDALKKFNKQKKPIKKFSKKYDAFLASDTIIKTIVSFALFSSSSSPHTCRQPLLAKILASFPCAFGLLHWLDHWS